MLLLSQQAAAPVRCRCSLKIFCLLLFCFMLVALKGLYHVIIHAKALFQDICQSKRLFLGTFTQSPHVLAAHARCLLLLVMLLDLLRMWQRRVLV